MRGSAIHRTARCAVTVLAAACALALAGCMASPSDSIAGTPVPGQHTDAPPARTTPVPAPSGGTTSEVISPATPGPITKVGFTQPASLNDGVTISLPSIKAMTAKAETPGEITGPAVAIEVRVQNNSKADIDVGSAVVTLVDSKGALAQPTTSDPYHALSGTVAPGASAVGTYVFRIPTDDRQALTLSVEYIAGAPTAHFVGAVS